MGIQENLVGQPDIIPAPTPPEKQHPERADSSAHPGDDEPKGMSNPTSSGVLTTTHKR